MSDAMAGNREADLSPLGRLRQAAGRARYAAAQGLRTAWYGAHYALIRQRTGGFSRPDEPMVVTRPDIAELRRAFFRVFRQDRANIEAGLYPAPSDVKPGELARTLRQSARLLRDARVVDERRRARAGTEVRLLPGSERFPTYYRQNFHYQSDGWFSEESARLYDDQVEVLFTGAADAMRRMALAEIVQAVRTGGDQRRVRYLDVAGGNGRFLRQVMGVFPRLDAAMLDLSPAYTAVARERLAAWPHVDVIEGAAEAMPLDDGSIDVMSCIYLFHELPPRVRPKVLAEIARVLKPGGVFVFADSLQFGDNPKLDGLLEYFPESFHEPYYKSYLREDFVAMSRAAGLEPAGEAQAHFLTRVAVFRKPG